MAYAYGADGASYGPGPYGAHHPLSLRLHRGLRPTRNPAEYRASRRPAPPARVEVRRTTVALSHRIARVVPAAEEPPIEIRAEKYARKKQLAAITGEHWRLKRKIGFRPARPLGEGALDAGDSGDYSYTPLLDRWRHDRQMERVLGAALLRPQGPHRLSNGLGRRQTHRAASPNTAQLRLS